MSRPPRVLGYLDARPIRDGLRMAVWLVRGFGHGVAKTSAPVQERLVSGVLVIGSVVGFPISMILMPLLIGARPRTRYYMSPERDTAIAITAGDGVWHVADHSTAHPGAKSTVDPDIGKGRELRRGLAPHLIALLDEADAELLVVAVNEKMAERYEEDLPGLLRTGEKVRPRGLKMRRPRRSEGTPPLDTPTDQAS